MAETKKDALATQQPASPGALVVPAGLEGMVTIAKPEGRDTGKLGNEDMTRDDILMPRIGLAQKMSPEIDATQSRYIEGLQFTDLFHTLSRKNFSKGLLYFVILKRDKPRWIEFIPLDQGGGIKDRNVPHDDPRTGFGPNGEKPIATKFYDFIVLLLNDLDLADPLKNIIALSMKNSALKAAKYLNFLIQLRGDKLVCKGVYSLGSGHETHKKSQGVYAIYKVENAGWLVPNSPIEGLVLQMHESWKDRDVEIDREPGDDDEPIDEEPAAPQAAAAASEM